MEESKKKMLGYIFAGIIALGLVLVIVGMVTKIGALTVLGITVPESEIMLFDDRWAEFAEAAPILEAAGVAVPSRTFILIAFIVTILGVVALIANAILKMVAKKEVKYLGIIAGAVTIIGAILIVVAAIMLGNSFVALEEMDDSRLKGMIKASMGIGPILGAIGGIIAGAAGIVSSLKQFN